MSIFKRFKGISNFKFKIPRSSAGMSYVELIVVLGIFSVLSAVVLFNYGKFQAKVDLVNLTNDVALKVVEAQKSAMSGKFPPAGYNFTDPCIDYSLPTPQPFVPPRPCKPSYGVFFKRNPGPLDPASPINKSFYYFADLNESHKCEDALLIPCDSATGEVLEKIDINKGNYVSAMSIRWTDCTPDTIRSLNVSYTRPNGTATFLTDVPPPSGQTARYARITFSSPKGVNYIVSIQASGRVQIFPSSVLSTCDY